MSMEELKEYRSLMYKKGEEALDNYKRELSDEYENAAHRATDKMREIKGLKTIDSPGPEPTPPQKTDSEENFVEYDKRESEKREKSLELAQDLKFSTDDTMGRLEEMMAMMRTSLENKETFPGGALEPFFQDLLTVKEKGDYARIATMPSLGERVEEYFEKQDKKKKVRDENQEARKSIREKKFVKSKKVNNKKVEKVSQTSEKADNRYKVKHLDQDDMVAQFKAVGIDANYFEMPRGHHVDMWQQRRQILQSELEYVGDNPKRLQTISATINYMAMGEAAARHGMDVPNIKEFVEAHKELAKQESEMSDADAKSVLDSCGFQIAESTYSASQQDYKKLAFSLEMMKSIGARHRVLDDAEASQYGKRPTDLGLKIEGAIDSGFSDSGSVVAGSYSDKMKELSLNGTVGKDGMEAYSHEMWHAIDWSMGDNESEVAHGGHHYKDGVKGSVTSTPSEHPHQQEMAGFVQDLLKGPSAQRWSDNNSEHMNSYRTEPTEMFARFAEQWTSYKIDKAMASGDLAVHPTLAKKYGDMVSDKGNNNAETSYWTHEEFEELVPRFESLGLIKGMMGTFSKAVFPWNWRENIKKGFAIQFIGS